MLSSHLHWVRKFNRRAHLWETTAKMDWLRWLFKR